MAAPLGMPEERDFTMDLYLLLIILWSCACGAVFAVRFLRGKPLVARILPPLLCGYAGYVLYWDYSLLAVEYEKRADVLWGLVMWLTSLTFAILGLTDRATRRLWLICGGGALVSTTVLAVAYGDPGSITVALPIITFITATFASYARLFTRRTDAADAPE